MKRTNFTFNYLERTVERIPFSGCWIWLGALNDTGYGRFRAHGTAHRKVWEYYNGKIPSKTVVRHSCGTRVCVNPSHLFLVPKRALLATHGLTDSPEYISWIGMRNRCQRPRDIAYKYYGARGITVCDRWQSFENFYADMGKRPKGLSLDRINSAGNYEPTNCRWATSKQQHENRRKFPKC